MPLRVIDIDEASLRQFGQWPWPRDRVAVLVEALSEMGASAIAFDMLFSEPDRLSPRNVVRVCPASIQCCFASCPTMTRFLRGPLTASLLFLVLEFPTKACICRL
jgi:hypothetical protein